MKPWPYIVRLLILGMMFPGLFIGAAIGFNYQLLLRLVLALFLALFLFRFSQRSYLQLIPAKIEFLGLGLQLFGLCLLYVTAKLNGDAYFGIFGMPLVIPYLAGEGLSIIGATWGLALTTRQRTDS
jgi:hypothetical protein